MAAALRGRRSPRSAAHSPRKEEVANDKCDDVGAGSGDPAGAAREAGNAAVAKGDFAAAEAHYTAALEALSAFRQGQGVEDLSSAALLCNRAQARLQLGLHEKAVVDASAALARLPPAESPDAMARRLRVKALYRRALSKEALGEAAEALDDINLVLKLTPASQAVAAAARRLQEAAPQPAMRTSLSAPVPCTSRWQPEHPYNSRAVLRLATSEALPGSVLGHTPFDSNPVVKFPCGWGVAAHHGHGGLCAILPLGPPKLLPRFRECPNTGKVLPVPGPPELGDDYFALPNMRPGDGVHVSYSRGGDLRRIQSYRDGKLDGLSLRFEAEGVLRYAECGNYDQGRLVEKLQNRYLPEGYLGRILGEIILPMKQALGLGLSPCEERLCYEEQVDVDRARAMDLVRPSEADPQSAAPPRLVSGRPRAREAAGSALPQTAWGAGFAPIGPGAAAEVPALAGGFLYPPPVAAAASAGAAASAAAAPPMAAWVEDDL